MNNELKKGDIIKVLTFSHELQKDIYVEREITRTSNDFVWFKGSGYCRIARKTIEKNPTSFKVN